MIDGRLILLIIGFLLVFNSSPVFAESVTDAYRNASYDSKISYSDALRLLESTIQLSENSLTGIVFENPQAQEKINAAWTIKSQIQQTYANSERIWHDGNWYLENSRHQESLDTMKLIDYEIDTIQSQLKQISMNMNEGKKLEDDYQYNHIFCFLFWCADAKNYDWVNFKIKDLDLKIAEVEKKKQSLSSEDQDLQIKIQQIDLGNKQAEIEQKQAMIANQERIKQEQQAELVRQQDEIQRQEQIRQEQEAEIERKQLQIEAEKQTTLQILASTNPLLKQIMTGEMTFWVDQVPYYAAPGVAEEVELILDTFESWSGVRRVYDEYSADLKITWIKEFSPHQGGLYWQSYVQVGLGQTACKGEWQPFVSHSVRQVLWHEIGHAMGYGHSNDQNNIMMGNGLQKYFYKEYEDDTFLKDGSYVWISFCNGGQYTFNIDVDSKSKGFKFWVITPETDATRFINENDGLHYPDCNEKGLWVSYSMTCNVAAGSKLLIFNPRDDGQAINVDVTTQYTGNRRTYDMTWDRDALKESSQYLSYLDSLR